MSWRQAIRLETVERTIETNGEALAAEVTSVRLLLLEGAGHGVDRADRGTIVADIVEHTAR